MFNQSSKLGDVATADVSRGAQGSAKVGLGGVFTITCYDKDGNFKWEDTFHNLVVNEGLQIGRAHV